MNRLNYRHLQYFWAVASEGHLTRAAAQLHVSQSALSSQVRQLEEQVGQALFERDGRRLRLTPMGRVVMNYADSIFALGSELMAAVATGQEQPVQQLRVGSVSTLSRNFQENFLRPVIGAEQVRLSLQSGSLDELLPLLASHKLDVVLANRPVIPDTDNTWRCRRLARQPVCLVGPPLPEDDTFQFPDDLHGRSLLLPSRSSDIRAQFDLVCEDLGVEPAVLAEVEDMAMLRLLTRDSGAVALVPAVVVQDELGSGLLSHYCDVPDVVESFYAITAQRRHQPAILEHLLAPFRSGEDVEASMQAASRVSAWKTPPVPREPKS
jgi:LysR family transcriptional activator of nhaA